MAEVLFRPPFEAKSFLLEVTHGCSHNKCTFCTMYREIPFRTVAMEDIEQKLREAAVRAPLIHRVFLEHGDAFVLSADKLAAIAEMIHRYLPNVDTITMYASIKNISTKTDEELLKLRALGINDLNVGVESGFDEALLLMNKGHTAAQAISELNRLTAAGIRFAINIIYGGAGAAKWEENAIETARLLNAVKPFLIFTGTMHPEQGCPLYDDMQSGKFVESTIGEYLDEEELLLTLLELDDCIYFSMHPSNVMPKQGRLSRDKEELLCQVTSARLQFHDYLDQRPERFAEGAIAL